MQLRDLLDYQRHFVLGRLHHHQHLVARLDLPLPPVPAALTKRTSYIEVIEGTRLAHAMSRDWSKLDAMFLAS